MMKALEYEGHEVLAVISEKDLMPYHYKVTFCHDVLDSTTNKLQHGIDIANPILMTQY
jgi:hypothetical protein